MPPALLFREGPRHHDYTQRGPHIDLIPSVSISIPNPVVVERVVRVLAANCFMRLAASQAQL